jgi:DNA replication protein DnaC
MNHVRDFPQPPDDDQRLANRLAKIPLHFEFIRWDTVGPSEESEMPYELQKRMWVDVKNNPERGRAFFGPSSIGKTVMEIALYRHILESHRDLISVSMLNPKFAGKAAYISGTAIVRTTAKKLMEAFRSWEVGESGSPIITPQTIERFASVGVRTYLFLGEFEKIRSSEFKREIIFDILDALRDFNGYLVLTGNLRYEDLNDETKYPLGTQKRVSQLCKVYDFWKI